MAVSAIIKRGEWWVPKVDKNCFQVILDQVTDLYYICDFCGSRDTVIQAGGNLGIWPVAMAGMFDRVVTAEPDPVNWDCLSLNITKFRDKIVALNCGFGEKYDYAGIEAVEPDNVGAHRLVQGAEIEVVPIDSLGLKDVSLIQLDVEGYELFALKGAVETIRNSCPIICLELKNHGLKYGYTDEDVYNWLADLNYSEAGRVHRDVIFKREGK